MGFPIHDRFGEIDQVQRNLHLTQSVTSEQLINHVRGKTLEELRFEGGPANPITFVESEFVIGLPNGETTEIDIESESEQGLGPSGHRYIQDPTDPGSIIDMRHFLESARIPFGLGEGLGALVEVDQARRGFPSAWEREDYKSNFFGAVFRNNYYDPDEEISDQFQEFFTDLENGELKGFVPAMEYFIQDGIDLAKDGKRALQQLEERIEEQIERLDNSFTSTSQQLGDRLRNALDRLRSSIEPPAYAQEVEDGFENAELQVWRPPTCPLILDLDGDGIELTSLDEFAVRFDMDGDGFREATGWLKSDDGLLVLDRNNDGYINDISELFGNQTTGGFTELQLLDSNNDGQITSADTDFSNLQVWRDLDGDGHSDIQELFSLDELNITKIDAVGTSVNRTNAGHLIDETGSFELADGTQREVANVWFDLHQLDSYYDHYSTFNTPVIITEQILNLPNLKGYGELPDLRIAMAQDSELLNLVESLSTNVAQGDITAARQLMRPLMYH